MAIKTKNKVLNRLMTFIEPHPIFLDSDEDIFTPREGLSINLWIEGGFEILAKPDIEINFNSISTGIIIFAFRENGNRRIVRVLAKKVIAFELIPDHDSHEDISHLLDLKKEQKN